MLHSKDTNRIFEIKIQFDSKENITLRFLNWLSFFESKSIYKSLDPVKKKGFKITDLLGMLLIVPFTGKTNMHSLLQSSSTPLTARKDSFYRMKKMHEMGEAAVWIRWSICKNLFSQRNGYCSRTIGCCY
uniref:hypothetical protein n=1 Tax=Arcticibacter svalbardensis TaxID=1288027 RepID=UPI001267CC51|nr:hypothetical protein [Arcticibacter svalbardensis]